MPGNFLRKYVQILMTQIFFDRGINDFKWSECLGSNQLYFKIGYWDRFFLEEDLGNVFEEHEDYDPDCGPMFSYYLKENDES